jgi:CubicO group peptidase (beta-lactamase class C family)
MPRIFIALPLLVSLACASSPEPAPALTTSAAEAKSAQPAEATPVTGPATTALPSGVTIEVPAGLVAKPEDRGIRLLDPEGQIAVGLYEFEGHDLAAALASAWPLLGAEPLPKEEQVIEPPAKDGWDQVRVVNYERDTEDRVLQAVLRRKGERIFTSLLRGPEGAVDKRAAQIRTFFGSLKVPGVGDLDLSSQTPTSIRGKIAELDTFIGELLIASGTPGLQIAVVEDGKVVHSKGFGVRELGKKAPVDADSLMLIGSVSKSMTTLLMANLVDAGKLRWEQPVTEVYPDFALADRAQTEAITVEELVCACAGLPRKDMPLVFEFEGKKSDLVFAQLATMKASTKPRETFQYQNQMVAAAGFIAGHVLYPKMDLERAYAEAMKTRVFGPLGMKRTTLDLKAATRDRNHATPHSMNLEEIHEKIDLAHEDFARVVGPSGGIWSNAHEMARYVIHELDASEDAKVKVASQANKARRWSQQVAIGKDVFYGLGFMVEKQKGLQHVSHGGGTMGFATLLGFYPDKGLGYVMIANGTGGHAIERAIRSRLFELWFGIDDKAKESFEAGKEAQTKAFAELRKKFLPVDEAVLAPLLGVHENAELGRFELVRRRGELWLDTGVYDTRLGYMNEPAGKRVFVLLDPPLAGIGLELDAPGKSFRLDRGQEVYEFSKVVSP